MDEPKTLTVPEAGRRYFDLGRNASYEAANRTQTRRDCPVAYWDGSGDVCCECLLRKRRLSAFILSASTSCAHGLEDRSHPR